MDKIPVLESLEQVPGRRIGVIGIGEGSDGLQAAQIASLLGHSGKNIEFVGSFRTGRESLGGEEIAQGVIRVTSDFRMQGRNFETPLAQDFPTYVVFDRGDITDLTTKMGALVNRHQVDGLVFVDGGGNVLAPEQLQKGRLNDHRTLLAAANLPVKKSIMIVSPGVDMPPDAHQLLVNASARRYRPSEAQRKLILDNFRRWGMPFENPHTFAFVPMIWQQALRGDFGPQRFPTQYPGDPPYIATPEGQDLMLVDYAAVVRGIH